MNISAIITARSLSSRFPRKHLALLDGVPMIEHIIRRLRQIEGFDHVILSTSDLSEDDDLAFEAQRAGAQVYRGSHLNLYERHQQTFEFFHVDAGLMVSGDSPFFHVGMIRDLVSECRQNPGYDIYMIQVTDRDVGETAFKIKTFDYLIREGLVFENHPQKERYQECYWSCHKGVASWKETRRIIEVDRYMPKEQTPMKLSIDYPLELAVANKIVEYLGDFPEEYDDIVRAYKEISSFSPPAFQRLSI